LTLRLRPSEEAVLSFLDRLQLDPVITLPCNYTGSLIRAVQEQPHRMHVPCSREEEGVGIACGAYLGGKRPAMIFQSSGLGNAVNVLASLSNLYRIPVVMLISHRGTPGEPILAQQPMGDLAPLLLKALAFSVYEIFSPQDLNSRAEVVKENFVNKTSSALLLPISYWNSEDPQPS